MKEKKPEVSNSIFDQIAIEEEQSHEKNLKEKKEELKSRISTVLAEKTKNKKSLFGTVEEREIKELRKTIASIIKQSETDLPLFTQKEIIGEMVLDITSLGKIHPLIRDVNVNEVLVNGVDEVWIESEGKLKLTNIRFQDEDELMNLARKIASNVGRRIDNSNPIVDARLPDGSRVHIVIPPVALKGITITIRKFSEEKLGIEDLIGFKSITRQAANFIEGCVKARTNLIVSGGTGSGKTTTLNIVSNFVPNDERIITIEDSAELQLNNEHVVNLESRPANAEGQGEVTIRDLVKASLRMRPERVIVGEVRDGSAFDLLQAMNTGHDGSMATIHANDPEGCMSRLDNLVLQAGLDLPAKFIRQTIAEAIDIVVQINRFSDGTRKITHISEVTEYDVENEIVKTEDIFLFKMTGKDEKGKVQGKLVYTGYEVSSHLKDKFLKYDQVFEDLIKEEKGEF